MRKAGLLWLFGIVLLLSPAAEANAQRQVQRQVPPPQRQLPPAQRQRASDSGARTRLETDVRRNFARLVRERVGLSEEQMGRLVPLTQRYEQQRRQLQMDERDARMSLRQTMRDEQTADAKQVDQLLQKLVDVQKSRAQLLESEQRDLAAIMTPMQRAKYMAFQDQVRRRLEQMRQRRVP